MQKLLVFIILIEKSFKPNSISFFQYLKYSSSIKVIKINKTMLQKLPTHIEPKKIDRKFLLVKTVKYVRIE